MHSSFIDLHFSIISGINAVIRPSLDGEINGACGQMSYKENQNNIIIDSFNEAIPLLNEIDSSTLVVFDVDSVLIIPKKIELHPFIFQKYKYYSRSIMSLFQ